MPDSRGPGVRRSRGGNVQLKNPGSLSNRCSTYGLKVLTKLKVKRIITTICEMLRRMCSRRVQTRNGRSLMRLIAINFRKACLQRMSRLKDLLSANNKIFVFSIYRYRCGTELANLNVLQCRSRFRTNLHDMIDSYEQNTYSI